MAAQPASRANGALVSEFADYLRSVEGLAELTVEAYATEARRYVDHLAARPAQLPESVAPDGAAGEVVAYLMVRQGEGAGSGTLAKALSALRAWYRFLRAERPDARGLAGGAGQADNPAARVAPPRAGRRIPRVLSVAQVERFLA
ncbi:MAG: site-specific integrase, partial [Spirochaetaceae bacterium]|nr:site-specific integrase [Spirochaetaceae bacterium]